MRLAYGLLGIQLGIQLGNQLGIQLGNQLGNQLGIQLSNQPASQFVGTSCFSDWFWILWSGGSQVTLGARLQAKQRTHSADLHSAMSLFI